MRKRIVTIWIPRGTTMRWETPKGVIVKVRDFAPRRMVEIGVEGDRYNEHDEIPGCESAGCVPA